MNKKAISIQEKYYTETAGKYDQLHISDQSLSGHLMALSFLKSVIELYQIKSLLDVGAGTGRTMLALKDKFPDLKITGIEPVEALREEAFKKGVEESTLTKGNGYQIDFKDNTFDLVCAFGVLHHVEKPDLVIAEMIRVSKKTIFISDGNNFGQGNYLARTMKNILRKFGLWKSYKYLKTGGKMYEISEGDGLYYSYSIFNNYAQIEKKCAPIHLLNTSKGKANFLNSASSVVLFAVKKLKI